MHTCSNKINVSKVCTLFEEINVTLSSLGLGTIVKIYFASSTPNFPGASIFQAIFPFFERIWINKENIFSLLLSDYTYDETLSQALLIFICQFINLIAHIHLSLAKILMSVFGVEIFVPKATTKIRIIICTLSCRRAFVQTWIHENGAGSSYVDRIWREFALDLHEICTRTN